MHSSVVIGKLQNAGNLYKDVPRFGEFCSCCYLTPQLQLACSILATWERPYRDFLYTINGLAMKLFYSDEGLGDDRYPLREESIRHIHLSAHIIRWKSERRNVAQHAFFPSTASEEFSFLRSFIIFKEY